MRGLLRCSPTLALSLVVLAACGDDDVPPVPTDAGPRDAQVRVDAGPIDGGELPDGSVLDGGELPDGGGIDGGSSAPSCSFDPSEDLVELATDSRARQRDVAVAAGPTAHALAWIATAGGFEQVFFVQLPASGDIASGTQITTGFSLQGDPALSGDATGWTLAWSGNEPGDFEIFAQRVDLVGELGERRRVTTRAGRDDSPALLALADGTLAAWVETRGADTTRVAVTRPLDVAAAPSGTVVEATGSGVSASASQLVVRQGGYGLAYVDSRSAAANLVIAPLDASRAPAGAPLSVTTEGNADGTFDVATGTEGGAAVFGVLVGGARAEVRARLLAATGAPEGSERVVTVAPQSGRDASIAPFAGGYVLAYRALEGDTAQLTLAFLADNLDVLGTLDVTEVAPTGGRTTVRVSDEGRIVVGWADVLASSTAIRAARIRCE